MAGYWRSPWVIHCGFSVVQPWLFKPRTYHPKVVLPLSTNMNKECQRPRSIPILFNRKNYFQTWWFPHFPNSKPLILLVLLTLAAMPSLVRFRPTGQDNHELNGGKGKAVHEVPQGPLKEHRWLWMLRSLGPCIREICCLLLPFPAELLFPSCDPLWFAYKTPVHWAEVQLGYSFSLHKVMYQLHDRLCEI